MSAAQLTDRLRPLGLSVLGDVPVQPDDPVPPGTLCLALIGPDGGAMWPVFTSSPEYADGAPDPLNRWSTRVLQAVAEGVAATALFPFGGPPWHPFLSWAQRSGRCFPSPVGLLVHDSQGLFVSFRGALALPFGLGKPARTPSPCETCAGQPCRKACPATALTPKGYDVPACKTHITSPTGAACLDGCLVRRACPVGQGLRSPAQSAFHMTAFTGERPQ